MMQMSDAERKDENTRREQIAKYRLQSIAAALGQLSRAHMEPD